MDMYQMRFFANLHALLGRPRVVSRALGYRACSSTKDKRFVVYPSPGIINEQNKYFWAQFALPPITFSGVDQAPNQRLVFLLRGPFSSSRAFFYSDALRFRPSCPAFFYRGSLHLFPFFPQKKRKNNFIANRIEPNGTSFFRL